MDTPLGNPLELIFFILSDQITCPSSENSFKCAAGKEQIISNAPPLGLKIQIQPNFVQFEDCIIII